MSIAPIAANKEEPIIVSKKGGLSKDAISKISSWQKTDATIIGGDAIVSIKTEKDLKDAKIDTNRIEGSNRQRTNAKILETYSKSGLKTILISKDGQRDKEELVDALTATSLAVKNEAPIVLATEKISNEQLTAIENKVDNKNKTINLYQVGYGISKNVIDAITSRISE